MYKTKPVVFIESTVSECDSQAGTFKADTFEMKFQTAESDQQTVDMARPGIDVENGGKKKSHRKKKTAVRDSGKEYTQTASYLCEQKGKEKTKDGNKQRVKKYDSMDNADENVKSTLPDSSHQEASDFSGKRKSGKKRKRLHEEAKKNKIKRDAGKDKSTDVSTEHTNTATSSSAQYHALEYLRTWKSARDRWTFQKVRQVWLLQHMYDSTKIGECDFIILLEYLEKLVGKARQATVEAAEKMIREAEDAEENNDTSSMPNAKFERIRQVLQILS